MGSVLSQEASKQVEQQQEQEPQQQEQSQLQQRVRAAIAAEQGQQLSQHEVMQPVPQPQMQQQMQIDGSGGDLSRRNSLPISSRPPPTADVHAVPLSPRFSRRQTVQGPMNAMMFGPPTRVASDFADDDDIDHGVSAAALAQPEPEADAAVSEGAVTLSTRVEYQALPSGQTQDVFGLITMQAAAAPPPESQTQERQPTDIVCVLDVSGSMTGDKLRLVQDAIRFIIDQSTTKDRISIIAFNTRGSRILRLRAMSGEGKNDANVATLRLAAGGGTSIASGLDMAIEVMEQRRYKNKVSAILLLTDGQDGSTRPQLPALLERAAKANSSIYAFGFGADHDAGLLCQISEQAHTPFTFVEKNESIRAAFAGTVGGLTSVVAQTVVLTLKGHVPIKTVHTGFTVTRASEMEVSVAIPDLFGSERRDVLVELTVPTSEAGVRQTLLEAVIQYNDLARDSLVKSCPVMMEAQRVEEPQPEQEPDEEVNAQRSRVETGEALRQATSFCDRGEYQSAQQLLSATALSVKSRRQSMTSAVMIEELDGAQTRMRSKRDWDAGGRAEIMDATTMHRTQRSCNVVGGKSSKTMYCTPTSKTWQSRSMPSGL